MDEEHRIDVICCGSCIKEKFGSARGCRVNSIAKAEPVRWF